MQTHPFRCWCRSRWSKSKVSSATPHSCTGIRVVWYYICVCMCLKWQDLAFCRCQITLLLWPFQPFHHLPLDHSSLLCHVSGTCAPQLPVYIYKYNATDSNNNLPTKSLFLVQVSLRLSMNSKHQLIWCRSILSSIFFILWTFFPYIWQKSTHIWQIKT